MCRMHPPLWSGESHEFTFGHILGFLVPPTFPRNCPAVCSPIPNERRFPCDSVQSDSPAFQDSSAQRLWFCTDSEKSVRKTAPRSRDRLPNTPKITINWREKQRVGAVRAGTLHQIISEFSRPQTIPTQAVNWVRIQSTAESKKH